MQKSRQQMFVRSDRIAQETERGRAARAGEHRTSMRQSITVAFAHVAKRISSVFRAQPHETDQNPEIDDAKQVAVSPASNR